MIYTSLPQITVQNYLFVGLLSFDGRYGLPNGLREALLKLKLGDGALMLDALYSTGFKAGQSFTFKAAALHLERAGIEAGEMLMRRGLNSGLFPKWKVMSLKKGRPMYGYRMPELKALVDQYCGGKMTPSDEVDTPALSTLSAYRKALYLSLIKRAAGIYSRFFLSQRLGITPSTSRNYDRQLDIVSERRVDKSKLYFADFEWVLSQAKKGKNWLQVKFRDGELKNFPLRLGIVYKYITRWHDVEGVYLVTQLANRYKLGESHFHEGTGLRLDAALPY